uniref:Sacsin-like n=1 Tax=Callorhinchus milii TaxID=7868 RepID=A0A4W3IY10_CALMI
MRDKYASEAKLKKSFGQKVPSLLDYLKGILRRYPDGGQILKELIQNADDAEASQVVFLFDERTHPSHSLVLPELEPFQGPALFVYNDSMFSEEDWEGIQTISCSVKRNDPNKVGQFGIGFNSVYHITDLPAIFSGSSVAMLEPRETIFEREGGRRWSLEDAGDREVLERCRDQFQPFRDVLRQVDGAMSWDAAMESRYFRGTLFRFPLRRAPTAISETLYDPGKVTELFESFAADADMSLLFLRHVASVSLGYLRADGERTETVLRVSAVAQDLPLLSPGAGGSGTCIKTVARRQKKEGEEERPGQSCRWLLTTCTGAGEDLAGLAASLSLTPRVDLAFPLTEPEPGFTGRLSCYLPLPDNESNRTGLPVHLNASFGLTDNRRHVKWPEPDQQHDEAARWNELLVSEVLPRAYDQLVLDAVALVDATDSVSPAEVYRLWPDQDKTGRIERWAVAGDALRLTAATNHPRWVKAEGAVFVPLGVRPVLRQALARALVGTGAGLTPAEKLLLLEFALADGRFGELNALPLLPRRDGSFARFLRTDPGHGLTLVETGVGGVLCVCVCVCVVGVGSTV